MAGSASGAVFVVAASGKNLGSAQPYGEEFEIKLRKKLADWKALPQQDRAPDAVKTSDAQDPIRQKHELPPGTLVVRVSNRPLEPDRKSDTGYRYVVAEDYPEKIKKVRRDWERYAQPADDFLWITAEEWKSLIPADPKVGQSAAVPENVV